MAVMSTAVERIVVFRPVGKRRAFDHRQRIHIGPWRRRRDQWLKGHQPAATLVLVNGFADPRFVAEVELEAVA